MFNQLIENDFTYCEDCRSNIENLDVAYVESKEPCALRVFFGPPMRLKYKNPF